MVFFANCYQTPNAAHCAADCGTRSRFAIGLAGRVWRTVPILTLGYQLRKQVGRRLAVWPHMLAILAMCNKTAVVLKRLAGNKKC